MFSTLKLLFSGSSQEAVAARVLLRFALWCVVLFGIIFSIIFVILLKQGDEYKLPQFYQMELLQVFRILQQNKLSPYIRQTYHRTIPHYHVISQKPEPGSVVKAGRTIELVVSLGQKISRMPDYTGLPVNEAKADLFLLYSAFEKIPIISEISRYSTNIEKGNIIGQSPSAFAQLNVNQNIMFLVSSGIATNVLIVSNYRWQNFKDVENKYNDFGIEVTFKTVETASARHAGKIFNQNPRAGTSLTKGDAISFEVGVLKGPAVGQPKREQLRVYSIVVPYRNAEDLAVVKSALSPDTEKNRKDFPDIATFEQNAVEVLKPVLRLVQISVKDELGSEYRFSEELFPGVNLDLPYRTFGSGTISVYIDDVLYDQLSFNDDDDDD